MPFQGYEELQMHRYLQDRILWQEWDPQGLLRLISEHWAAFSLTNAVTILNRCGACCHGLALPALWSRVLGLVPGRLSKAADPDMVRLDGRFAMLVMRLRDFLGRTPEHFEPRALANTINGLGRLSYDPGEAFIRRFIEVLWVPTRTNSSSSESSSLLHDDDDDDVDDDDGGEGGGFDHGDDGGNPDNPRQVSRTGTFAPVRPSDPDPRGARRPREVVWAPGFSGFNCQELAITLNGLARLGRDPGEAFLLQFAEACTARGFVGFKPQELAITIHGMGRFGFHPGELCLSCFTQACLNQGLVNFKPQELTITIAALAKLGFHPGSPFCEEFVKACLVQGSHGFKAQEQANTLEALAVLDYPPGDAAVRALCDACVARAFEDFKPRDLVGLLSSLARLGYHPSDKVVDALIEACLGHTLPRFRPQELAMLIEGFATLGYPLREPFVTDFLLACQRWTELHWDVGQGSRWRWRLKDVQAVLWSCALLECLDRPPATELLEAFRPVVLALMTAAMEAGGEAQQVRVGSRPSVVGDGEAHSDGCLRPG
jgi:hypothetical protein